MKRVLSVFFLILSLSGTALAQQFSIQRMQITTSGGEMTGAEFALTGAVEKNGAESGSGLNGGEFTLDGSASSISVAVHSSGSPQLQLRITANAVELTWALDDAVGHVLQSSTHLGTTASWQNEQITPAISDGIAKATVPRRPGLRFFRLQRTREE